MPYGSCVEQKLQGTNGHQLSGGVMFVKVCAEIMRDKDACEILNMLPDEMQHTELHSILKVMTAVREAVLEQFWLPEYEPFEFNYPEHVKWLAMLQHH